jgi:hypothetical protein
VTGDSHQRAAGRSIDARYARAVCAISRQSVPSFAFDALHKSIKWTRKSPFVTQA